MLDYNLINNMRHQISKLVALKSEAKIDSLDKLGLYGIEYRAPYDAAKTDFDDKSVDACISTNTLEHIPKESIIAIFLELNRILKDGGIVSAKIDYSDHYANTDKNISLLNYLNFDESSWQRYNHNCHYQNRLRHYDYIEIFNRCGFDVI
jgi:SAM-dependent methyltransferase